MLWAAEDKAGAGSGFGRGSEDEKQALLQHALAAADADAGAMGHDEIKVRGAQQLWQRLQLANTPRRIIPILKPTTVTFAH